MPVAYSRWRAVWMAVVWHMGAREVGKLLCLSERSVRRYVRTFRTTGDVAPLEHRNGPRKLLDDHEQLIIFRFLLEQPSIYLHELQKKVEQYFGVSVSIATLCRTIHHMGVTRQVMRHIALQRSDAKRAKFIADISVYDPAMFIWLDESGQDKRNAVRRYGYSVRGIRPVEKRLLIRGVRYSSILIMSMDCVHDVFLAEGSVDGDRFQYFLQTSLLPILNPYNTVNPRSVVVVSIHHVQEAVDLIESVGYFYHLTLINPCEPVFGKVKALLKENDQFLEVYSVPRVFLAIAFSS
jgi:transposase